MDAEQILAELNACSINLEYIAAQASRAHQITQEARFAISRANGSHSGRDREITEAQAGTELAVLNGGSLPGAILEASAHVESVMAAL